MLQHNNLSCVYENRTYSDRPDSRVCRCKLSGNTDSFKTYKLIALGRKVIENMEKGDYEAIPSLVDSVFYLLEGDDVNQVLNWCINSIHEILQCFEINKIHKEKIQFSFNVLGHEEDSLRDILKVSYLEHLKRVEEALKSLSEEPNQELIKRACEMVEQEYSKKDFSLYGVADRLHISYGYLCTMFKQITGNNFNDYLISVRLKTARRMILKNRYKMYEIADMVGYKSERYFSLAFKRYFGVRPSDYKKRLGGV